MSKIIKIGTLLVMFLLLICIFAINLTIDDIITSRTFESKCTSEKTKVSKFNQNENIVLLGDSITEIYPINDIYDDMPIVKSGVSGYKTNDILKHIDSMLYQYNPTKVILLIGTNDIMNDIGDDMINETISNIEKISQKIKKNRRNTKIYIESIYPVNRNMKKEMVADRTNEAIQKINDEIEKYCRKNNIIYIDMYDKLIDNNGNFDEKYTYDGLHPNTLGYAKITNVLLPYIYDNYDLEIS